MNIVQKLINLGWEPAPYTKFYEADYYLRKEFEVSNSNELENYTSYKPLPNERVFIAYEIFPNLQIAHWCIWRDTDNPAEAPWDFDDYSSVVELALEDRLFTYPE